jgi:16S rRNA (cytosine967-C5)-methyltransferase
VSSARQLAVDALVRVEQGAYANLLLPQMLSKSDLDERDRAFATELVYGVTRMRRACDWLVDRFVLRDVDPVVRNVLRVGAYQLVFLDTPPHAAVATTVDLAPRRARGFVNAVLRRVAAAGPPDWPDSAVRLSYPDWILSRLSEDLGAPVALAALEQMNRPPKVTVRPDGYVQDRASQWVAEFATGTAGDLVVDVCAGPGGKATWVAASGARRVVALDVLPSRAALVAANASRLGAANVLPVVADGASPPLRPGSADCVLVDAPCSGLGVLRRRPDARWRIQPDDLPGLVALQRRLLDAAASLVRPGGRVVYSVCTLSACETSGIDEWLAASHPELVAQPPAGPPWEEVGRGARLLPQTEGTDGMFVLALVRTMVRAEDPRS